MWAIVSNNCWGSSLYQARGLAYNTPTIGLWFNADDYIAFLSDFRRCLAAPIAFTAAPSDGSQAHPIGTLPGGIKVMFQHYDSVDEARRTWTERAARLPPDDRDLYVKICDREGFEERHLRAFATLPFAHKVAFVKRGRFDLADYPWAIEVDSPHSTVNHGLELYDQVAREGLFDVAEWVKK